MCARALCILIVTLKENKQQQQQQKRKQQRNTNPQDYLGFVYIAIQMVIFRIYVTATLLYGDFR